ncbi:ZYBA0S13-01200g1_1 [Zygosaccharomyces bailii CLIB 213]|uniref:ZYBA0S13-01200g1_1 n=1 Tax=Zygosaccharomyces bailii (strain CLIB 213 / ATCC 58445 / CBS 680 / BCRC 21525 / NBRC 1098 / NCYC 1416 / NRRL Y-2227) TaxID=1333698 RepID=A0A8J2TB10_ZYGB2|nr:ZYBA0S13-01200g1_1 [Zygosaccharomyces bailii CLIB 213]
MFSVRDVVNQYQATEDNDLKYMALKEELPALEICDELPSYVGELLLPVLLQEPDAEIVNLVSQQMYPNAVALCLQRDKQGPWFDQVVVSPLLDQMHGPRPNVALQTLRNIARRAAAEQDRQHQQQQQLQHQYQQVPDASAPTLGRCPELLEQFLQTCDDTVLSVETLYHLVRVYYRGAAGTSSVCAMPDHVLQKIVLLCRNPRQGETERLLLRESVARASLAAVAAVAPLMSLRELACVSALWWQFGPVAEQLLHSQLLPALADPQRSPLALAVLLHFEPFYTQITTNSATLYGPENERLLRDALASVAVLHESGGGTSDRAAATPSENVDDSDSDADPSQTAYLAELPSDEELEFESDSDSHSEAGHADSWVATSGNGSAEQTRRSLLEKLGTGERSPQYEEVPALLAQLRKSPDESIASLPALQTALETLAQLATTRAPQQRLLDWSQLCQQLVLPRLEHDRTFVHKLKAGNLTQSIDEGATLRASAQGTLRQLLPLVDFRTVCLALAQELRHGVHDRDSGVQQLAADTVRSLLASHHHELIGLEWDWYARLLAESSPAAEARPPHGRA